ncbi:MAG: hypothetical protein OEM66_01130 [Acidimicrobiia bacterium]|nr:hypothetical protein [Acidimicrobiia bacterium]
MNPVISGGAGRYEAAAIVAVLQRLLEEEEAARAQPPTRPEPRAWVRVGVQKPFGRFAPPVLPESP